MMTSTGTRQSTNGLAEMSAIVLRVSCIVLLMEVNGSPNGHFMIHTAGTILAASYTDCTINMETPAENA